MQIGQLKEIISSFSEYAEATGGIGNDELRLLLKVFPANSKETTAAFVKRVKLNLQSGVAPAPLGFALRYNAVKKLLASLGVKKTVCDDWALIGSLWTSSPSASFDALVNQLVSARDYIPPPPPPRVRKTSGTGVRKKMASPSPKQIAAEYIEKLKQAALNPSHFEKLFGELQSNYSLHDDRIKEIANKLNNYSPKSPERPKTREEALQRILGYQHKKAASASAGKALELTPL